MRIEVIKTEVVTKPQPLEAFIEKFLPTLEEGCILAITSKVVSICEGRMMPDTIDKAELVRQEADKIIPNPDSIDPSIMLTYKDHVLIPSAGIDASNTNGHFVLYPKKPFESARRLWQFLKYKYKLERLGVLITDSHTTPLRKGVTGFALAWWGFDPVKSCVGIPDIFGYPLRVTNINVADALAVSAVFNMGESYECTPVAIITEAPHVHFNNHAHSVEAICIDPAIDLYRPLLQPLLD